MYVIFMFYVRNFYVLCTVIFVIFMFYVRNFYVLCTLILYFMYVNFVFINVNKFIKLILAKNLYYRITEFDLLICKKIILYSNNKKIISYY
jgi:hypothetical protein